jgi:hypothetical protein
VAIQLGLSEKEATRNYTEYWRLAIPIQDIFAKVNTECSKYLHGIRCSTNSEV